MASHPHYCHVIDNKELQNADPTSDMKYQYQLSPKDDILQLVFVLMIILMHTNSKLRYTS